MGKQTGIHWTDHTFNPWIGCLKVSPGCVNCYAETLATNRMQLKVWGPAETTHRKLMSEDYWKQPIKWNAKAAGEGVRRRVFCASMADVFEDHPDVIEPRERLWKLIDATPALDWLLLTKRPENIERMMPQRWERVRFEGEKIIESGFPGNVWLGTSAERQNELLARWPVLESAGRSHGAKYLFLSLEPLLGPIDIEVALEDFENSEWDSWWVRGVDWIIVGGESGPGCRPMDLCWAQQIRDDCREHGVPLFFKQVGGTKKIDGVAGGDLLDGERIQMFPWDEWGEAAIATTQPAGRFDGAPKMLTQKRLFE